MIFALLGNQNCGKTTLFNQLTGSNQHVGNFPGVTVEQKVGNIRGLKNAQVVDLPGIYSLRPYSSEEIVTRDFMINTKPDAIINIVDATNIERNLYLSLQALEMGIPMVIALNMMDEVRGNGGTIDIKKLSHHLGAPVIPISAAKNEGVDDLIKTAYELAKTKTYPSRIDFCEHGAVHRSIHAISHFIEDHAALAGLSPRFCATKLIDGDTDVIKSLNLTANELETVEHSIVEMERESGMDRNSAIADMRYSFIEKAVKETVIKPAESKEHKRSRKIDKILTGKYTAMPIFLCSMLLIFFLTFNVIGKFLSDVLVLGIDALSGLVGKLLSGWGVNSVVHSLVIDGIFAGVGSVLSFLPVIVVLFFFLSILEDTGYMARVAFVMDKLLRKIGLSGRSFVPMLIGFGCSVPAIMATRTLPSERDRKMTVLLTPFMSCSAKIPIYTVFVMAFFAKYQALIMLALYLTGIIVGIVVALIMNKTIFKGNPVPFVMELPNYRLPSPKSVGLLMWDKAKDFLVKAFTVIFIATIVVWFLQTFDYRLNVAKVSGENSLLEVVGKFIAPIFKPLGFGDWRITTSLIAGFTAKEAVVSTLSVLLGVTTANLSAALGAIFSPVSAFSFLLFTLLYTPCVAAITAIKREFHSGLIASGVALAQCVIAYAVAFAFYTISGLLGNLRAFGAADIILISVIAVLFIAAITFIIIQKRKGKCVGCSGGNCENCNSKKKDKND